MAFLDPANQALLNQAVRAALAAELGARPEDIVGTVNATEALNIAFRGLGLRPGDEIVTTDHEYAAMDKLLQVVCAETGAVVRRARVPLPLTSENAFTAALLALFGPRTRVLFLSHVTSMTALRFPLDAVIAAARAAGVLVVIDGAHAPGLLPLDLGCAGRRCLCRELPQMADGAERGRVPLAARRAAGGAAAADRRPWLGG